MVVAEVVVTVVVVVVVEVVVEVIAIHEFPFALQLIRLNKVNIFTHSTPFPGSYMEVML